jgi:hypothetical protein
MLNEGRSQVPLLLISHRDLPRVALIFVIDNFLSVHSKLGSLKNSFLSASRSIFRVRLFNYLLPMLLIGSIPQPKSITAPEAQSSISDFKRIQGNRVHTLWCDPGMVNLSQLSTTAVDVNSLINSSFCVPEPSMSEEDVKC